ncbi:DUF4405 domain-containing protein [Paenibacillus sp. P46E]|uniref:DUF4405 domain-containing protein n=1 Tax=Paenibacillus sp. P46E TaxID=1349436 RepID=UPI0009402E8C|nr:DUF4405 domain-containing protein [Paenibacillus sp. P46E]OKP97969.1 hypothetical protein A3849_12990 [Paenibacillus sp. P46E]
MKHKAMIKIVLDLVMSIMLPILMAFILTGQKAHEWIGVAMFVMFITHNLLNFRWYKNLRKGKYTAFRIFQTAVNLSVFICMIGLMVSGIMMSRYPFAFMSIHGGKSFARELHMLASYWGFIFMSVHVGLHWNMIMMMMRKAVRIAKPSGTRKVILRVIAAGITAYGVYAFIRHDIASYLFLKTMFISFEFEQYPVLYFADYLAMIGLCICVAYYAAKGIQRISPKRGKLKK